MTLKTPFVQIVFTLWVYDMNAQQVVTNQRANLSLNKAGSFMKVILRRHVKLPQDGATENNGNGIGAGSNVRNHKTNGK